jgi:cyclopropane-fatty-acyl-phospholipid synthase
MDARTTTMRVALSNMSRSVVTRLFRAADISIDGDRPWDVRVNDDRFFQTVLRQGTLGFGESYMAGWWCTDDLEEVAYRLSKAHLHWVGRALPTHLTRFLVAALTNQQNPEKSLVAADRHYNLGNDLFLSFLGKYKSYSCAYFYKTSSLDEAQILKMHTICQNLRLSDSDHLLDIGGGWGEFAHFAATNYGCTVTSINIADEQLRYARELCRELPVEVAKCDYRELAGTYDKIASIAMIGHVGPKNYRHFMQIMYDCLTKDGVVLIETTGSRFSRKNIEPWIDKYIFPGAVAPTLRQIDAAGKGLLTRTRLDEFGHYYPATLRSWHANLMTAWPKLSARYPETTRRMLEYYLLTVAGAFRASHLKYWRIVLEKSSTR